MSDSRAADIRRMNALSADEVVQRAGEHLVVVENLDELHRHFAESIATTVEANSTAGRLSALILPYGPVGQYPVLRGPHPTRSCFTRGLPAVLHGRLR